MGNSIELASPDSFCFLRGRFASFAGLCLGSDTPRKEEKKTMFCMPNLQAGHFYFGDCSAITWVS